MLASEYRDTIARRNFTFIVIFIVLFFPLIKTVEFYPWVLFGEKNLKITTDFLSTFYPPNLNNTFLLEVFESSLQTVAIATVGLFFALLIGIPSALLITTALSVSEFENRKPVFPYLFRYFIRALLILLRSIPEIVWALIFVRVVGLGPTAGILAIALTYGGMLGKVYAEILESGDNPPGKYAMQIGCSRLQVLMYFLIPQNLLELLSYTIYRWECAIRSTVIMGFVGAGGLGFQLESSLKMFAGDEVLTILFAFIMLVWLSDYFSKSIRRSLT